MDLERMRNVAAIVVAYFIDDVLDGGERQWEKVTVNIEEYVLSSEYAFQLHFRLTKPEFMDLSLELQEALRDNLQRYKTPFDHVLLMVLWIMATPDSFRSVALRFGVHPSQLHTRYVLVIKGLCQLGSHYIRWPTREEREVMERRIERQTGFPGVVGCMDAKHFSITCPIRNSVSYRNYYHGYSMKAQAVCDDQLIVRDLYVGEAGCLHDSRIYRRSPLSTSILTDRELFNNDQHLVADSAYPLQERIMCPFINNGHLTAMQKNFNKNLSKVRVRVEHLFGDVAMVWRRIDHLEVRDMEYCAEHIAATFVLHNFKIIHGERPQQLADEDEDDDINFVEQFPHGEVPQDDDPFVPEGNGELRAEAQQLGEQKRWNICNEL